MAWQELPWIPEKMEKNNPNSILHVSQKQESIQGSKSHEKLLSYFSFFFWFLCAWFRLRWSSENGKEDLDILKRNNILIIQPWVAYESRNMNREQEILNIAGLIVSPK